MICYYAHPFPVPLSGTMVMLVAWNQPGQGHWLHDISEHHQAGFGLLSHRASGCHPDNVGESVHCAGESYKCVVILRLTQKIEKIFFQDFKTIISLSRVARMRFLCASSLFHFILHVPVNGTIQQHPCWNCSPWLWKIGESIPWGAWNAVQALVMWNL